MLCGLSGAPDLGNPLEDAFNAMRATVSGRAAPAPSARASLGADGLRQRALARLAAGGRVRFVQFGRPRGEDWHAIVQLPEGQARIPLTDLVRHLALVDDAPTMAAINKQAGRKLTPAQKKAEQAQMAVQRQLQAESNAKADAQAAAIRDKSFFHDLWDQVSGPFKAAAGGAGTAAKAGLLVSAGVGGYFLWRAMKGRG